VPWLRSRAHGAARYHRRAAALAEGATARARVHSPVSICGRNQEGFGRCMVLGRALLRLLTRVRQMIAARTRVAAAREPQMAVTSVVYIHLT
jgi:hypothetical protein